MNNELNNHLVDLHHKVAALKVYDTEAGKDLNKYCHEFGKMMTDLLTLNEQKFNEINLAYIENTYKNCSKAAKADTEGERSAAFYDGVGALNININDSLDILARRFECVDGRWCCKLLISAYNMVTNNTLPPYFWWYIDSCDI